MAHEVFENEESAAIMNAHFINIKIDREERPDIDQQVTFLHCADLAATDGFYRGLLGLPLALDQEVCRIYRVGRDAFLGFCRGAKITQHLKTRNWAAFARGYNGPDYASNAYHTKMARAYERYKRQG